jgi:hypothetical protein
MHSAMENQSMSHDPAFFDAVRGPDLFRGPANYNEVVCGIANFTALTIANPAMPGRLSFREVITDEEWSQVGAFRLREYAATISYMLNALDSDGRDAFDERSRTFAAWWDGAVVASIRLSPYPFETARHVPDEKLAAFLGDDWRTEYVEWTRLLVDTSTLAQRLMPAMIMFAGVKTLFTSPYRKYFGYASTKLTRLFTRFGLTVDEASFMISKRSQFGYSLLKGDFVTSLDCMAEQFHDERKRSAPVRPRRSDRNEP